MSLSFIKTFTFINSFTYACAMLSYTAGIVGFRFRKARLLLYIIFGLSSSLYTYMTIFQVPLPVIYVLAFLIILLLFHFMLSGTWTQHIFASGNFIFHIICIRGITLALFSLFSRRNLNWVLTHENLHDLSIGLSFFIAACYLVFFSYKLYPMGDIKAVSQKTEYLNIMSASQGVLNVLLILGSTVYYFKEIPEWFSWYHLAAYILIFISFYLLFNFCVEASKLQKYRSAYHLYEQQLDKQVDAYATQMQYIQQMRKFKHDWIHMREILFPLVEAGDKKGLLKFLNQIDITMHDLSQTYKEYSGHPLIQAILLHCNTLCQKQKIHFEASVILPGQLPLNDIDLCRIFTNITNNALEANEHLPDAFHRYISISTSIRAYWYTATCVNSFDGVLKTINGEYHSLKADSFSHGFGIKNMEDILASCGGFLKIEPDLKKHEFKIRIHIPIEATRAS